ncbi:MAG: ABC-2 transporter permease [Oscillospiraceae bacterium]|nr:ABC-2 transporter permease [Oscillospiraceae bacterium]
MIGLLKKDLFALKQMYLKNLLIVFVLYTVMVLMMEVTFLVYFIIWLMSFYSLSAFSLDEASGWHRYARTLPVSAGQVVGARYLTAVVMTAVGVAFGLAVSGVYGVLNRQSTDDLCFTIPLIAGLALASVGLLLPAAYQWGADKARNAFLVLFMLVCAGVYLLRGYDAVKDVLVFLEKLLERGFLLPLLALAAGILILLAGFAASCAIYRKKEF